MTDLQTRILEIEADDDTGSLARALEAVLDVLDAHPAPRKEADPTGYTTARIELLEGYVREAITEALGSSDVQGGNE